MRKAHGELATARGNVLLPDRLFACHLGEGLRAVEVTRRIGDPCLAVLQERVVGAVELDELLEALTDDKERHAIAGEQAHGLLQEREATENGNSSRRNRMRFFSLTSP